MRPKQLLQVIAELGARRGSPQELVDALEQGEVAEAREQVRMWTAGVSRLMKAHVARAARTEARAGEKR